MERMRVLWVKEEGEKVCQVGDDDGWMGLRAGYSREGKWEFDVGKPEFKNRNAQKGPAWDGKASNLNSNNHYLFPPPTFKPLSVQKKFDNGIRTALLNIGRAASQFGESILKRAEKSGKC